MTWITGLALPRRPKPYVLDDATITRTKRVNGEGLECCGVYDEQLRRCRRQLAESDVEVGLEYLLRADPQV